MLQEFDFRTWMPQQLALVEGALSDWVSAAGFAGADHHAPADLVEAMRYAVLDGGKRLRPLLVLAAYHAVNIGTHAQQAADVEDFGELARRGGLSHEDDDADIPESALRTACAVELIHAYSLVHDDMPCMDNDVLRRGKPTVHVKYGEATALLAGDALQALAFELLTPEEMVMPAAQQSRLCRLLSRAAGCAGMAGGQAIDLASVGRRLTEEQLRQMHRLKTGALLRASVVMGAVCGGACTASLAALHDYGEALGLAFQVVDDILDVTADSSTLGKTAGKDADNDKPTYVSLMGLEHAATLAQELLAQALAALQRSDLADTRALRALAVMVVERDN